MRISRVQMRISLKKRNLINEIKNESEFNFKKKAK